MAKLSVVTVELENAGKIIEEHLRADATRVPDLDVALVSTGGWVTSKYRWDALLIVFFILRSTFIIRFLFGCFFRCLAAFCQPQNHPTTSSPLRRVGS
jgi:hypothetical protein